MRDKNTYAGTWVKSVAGLYAREGHNCGTLQYYYDIQLNTFVFACICAYQMYTCILCMNIPLCYSCGPAKDLFSNHIQTLHTVTPTASDMR